MVGLVQIGAQQLADRYAYFPFLGLYMAVAWAVPELWPISTARRRLLPLIASVAIAVYAAAGFAQVGLWRDSVRLFRHVLTVADDNPLIRLRLASALFDQHQLDDAAKELQHTIRIMPGFADAHVLLGCVFQAKKEPTKAASEFQVALKLDDKLQAAHVNLGTIFLERRQFDQARHEFDRVIELNEKNARAYINRAGLFWEVGEYEKSIADCRRALALDPHLLVCERLIGRDLVGQGRVDEAINQFQHVLAAAPGDKEAVRELARLRANGRPSSSAIQRPGISQRPAANAG
jgi:Tfp pilus assembly protein PilF